MDPSSSTRGPYLLCISFICLLAVRSVAQEGPPRVACIGDSITEGAGLANPAVESYPARVQRLAGTNYIVNNYGLGGRTLLKRGDFPYWRERAFTQSHEWNPNIVLIKLGTNDSKSYNWRHGTNFVSEYEEFIASYAELPSRPRVILCTPAPVFRTGAFDISPGIVATNIAPMVRDIGARLGLEVIDFHERLAGHSEWFPDTVHPNTRGMAVMAAIVIGVVGLPGEPVKTPELSIEWRAPRRAAIHWPGGAETYVLQSVGQLKTLTNTAWAVADMVVYSDGSRLTVTNLSTLSRYFRLWKP